NTSRTLQFCRLQKTNPLLGPFGLSPWIKSIQRSTETGAMYSASFPFTDPTTCNAIGRLYRGRVIVQCHRVLCSRIRRDHRRWGGGERRRGGWQRADGRGASWIFQGCTELSV